MIVTQNKERNSKKMRFIMPDHAMLQIVMLQNTDKRKPKHLHKEVKIICLCVHMNDDDDTR